MHSRRYVVLHVDLSFSTAASIEDPPPYGRSSRRMMRVVQRKQLCGNCFSMSYCGSSVTVAERGEVCGAGCRRVDATHACRTRGLWQDRGHPC
jgi:hypothetical protein